MKNLFTICLLFLSTLLFAQSEGDTIFVETFNYTQTHGSGIRDTMIAFPDNPELTFEKIIMLYNMRCKDGLVSTSTDRNKGCGEWDYSCNTYITDSSRVDSVLSFTASHSITNFSGNTFNYVENPTYDFYQYREKNVVINSTNSENLINVGTGSLPLPKVIDASQHSGKSQYLYTQAEMSAAGLVAGEINGLLLNNDANAAEAAYLKIKIKQTEKTSLSNTNPDLDGFTEVYFRDYSFTNGQNRLQFYTPFTWDGTSNIIVEFSFTNNNTSSALNISGNNTTEVSGIYSNNGYSLNNAAGEIEIPTDAFSSISDEVTITFWSYGNEKYQPSNNCFFHGEDGNNNRTINMHLPWGNSNVYFDCGNDGGAYDRVNKAASPQEFEGKWNHWAVTKNANSGFMKVYLNGNLWLDGVDKTRLIDIQNFIIGNAQRNQLYYFGKMDEISVWDAELSEEEIQDWMYKPIDPRHPKYSNLVAYYKIDEGQGSTTMDASVHAKTATINGYMYWVYERGENLNHGFVETNERPNLVFAQGDYNITVTDEIVTDSVANIPNIVKELEIIRRYGTMASDSINVVSVNEFWETTYEVTYNPEGVAIDSTEVVPTGTIEITELDYYNRYPMWFEIMSFVTPYGIWLDFGMDGKTWVVDVSDYAPILKGNKRMTVERGGQWQEDMDIKFAFIVGTPAHDVLDVQQLWRADARDYNSILQDRSFEAREVMLRPDGEQFKIRSVITGHGQEGEFIGRYHNIVVNGEEFKRRVWTECATNAIYPQGGTWIYDRAGWCPGQPSDLAEYDITGLVIPGQLNDVDYSLDGASGTSNYIVNNQLVTYGGPNFSLDAAIVEVLKPNSADAKNERFNPACSYPEVVIKNNGSSTLYSLDFEYYETGGEAQTYSWTGELGFLDTTLVVLPVNDVAFWLPTSNEFVVKISNPNGGSDEYLPNNTFKTHFEGVDVFPASDIIVIECKTNNYGWQTWYTLYDGDGNVYLEWDGLENNTVYSDPLILSSGCYKLQINDRADDGLYWWNGSTQGTGSMKVKNYNGDVLFTFEPEFGRFAIYEFGIGEITSTTETPEKHYISAYPNPANDELHLSIAGFENTKLSIRLLNAMSATVYEKEIATSSSVFNTTLNIAQLPSGIYFLQVQSDEFSEMKKIIKR